MSVELSEKPIQKGIIVFDVISISLIVFMLQSSALLSTFVDTDIAVAVKGLAMIGFGIGGLLLARLFFGKFVIGATSTDTLKTLLTYGLLGAGAIVIVQVVWIRIFILTPAVAGLNVIDIVGGAVTAIAETLFFQCFLLMWMRKIGYWQSIILSAVSFAIFHIATHPLEAAGLGSIFVSGVVLNILMLKTSRPSVPMLAHLLFNVILAASTIVAPVAAIIVGMI